MSSSGRISGNGEILGNNISHISLRPDLVIAHYESSNYDSGTGIWTDAGPNGYHLTSTGGTATTSTVSGKTLVNLSSTQYFLRNISETYALPVTVMMVLATDTNATSGRIFGMGTELAGGGINIASAKNTNGVLYRGNSGAGSVTYVSTGLEVVAMTFAGGTNSYQILKGVKGTKFATSATNSAKTNIILNGYGGDVANGTYKQQCRFGEVIVYKGEFLKSIYEYLFKKWSLNVPQYHLDSSNAASYAIDGSNNITNLYNIGSDIYANYEQTDATRRPILSSGFLFDGTNDVMTSVGSNYSVTAIGFTFICVYSPAASANMTLVGDSTATNKIRQDGVGRTATVVTSVGTITMNHLATPDVNERRILVVYGDSAYRRYLIDGIPMLAVASSIGNLSTRSIGALGTASEFTNGTISEIIMYPFRLKDKDLDEKCSALATKWSTNWNNILFASKVPSGFDYEFGVSETQLTSVPIESWTSAAAGNETITTIAKHGLWSPAPYTAETFTVTSAGALDGGPYTDNKAGTRLITFAGISSTDSGSTGNVVYTIPRLDTWNGAIQRLNSRKFRVSATGYEADGLDDFMIIPETYTGEAWTLLIDVSYLGYNSDFYLIGSSSSGSFLRWDGSNVITYASSLGTVSIGSNTKFSGFRYLLVLTGDLNSRQFYVNGTVKNSVSTPIGYCRFNLIGISQFTNAGFYCNMSYKQIKLVNYKMSNSEINTWGNGREALAALGAVTWTDI